MENFKCEIFSTHELLYEAHWAMNTIIKNLIIILQLYSVFFLDIFRLDFDQYLKFSNLLKRNKCVMLTQNFSSIIFSNISKSFDTH